LVTKKALVGTNFLRKREHDGGERYVQATTLVDTMRTKVDHYRDFLAGKLKDPNAWTDAVDKIQADLRQQELKDYAGRGLVLSLYGNVIAGKGNVQLTPLIRSVAEAMARDSVPLTEMIDMYDNARNSLDLVDVHTSQTYQVFLSLANATISRFLQRMGWNKVQATSIMAYAMMREQEQFIVDDHVSGSYVSEKRSPFFFDFMQVSQNRGLIDSPEPIKIREPVCGLLTMEAPTPNSWQGRELIKQVQKLMKAYHEMDITSAPERVYIGSDAKRSTLEFVVEEDVQLEPIPSVISTKDDLHRTLEAMAGELPDKGKTAYVVERVNIDPSLGNPQQLIACWTQANNRKKKVKKTLPKKMSVDRDEKPMIAAVARIYDDQVASEIFGVPKNSIPALRAHETMGTYGVQYDAFVSDGVVFVAPKRGERSLVDLMQTLSKENGGVHSIPENVLSHHSIEII